MSLRRKTLANILILFVSLIVILFFISRFIILENLKEVEEKNTLRNVDRVKNVVTYIISQLESTTSDWASWDDTYEFVENPDEEYIENNLVDETFDGLNLNVMLFFDLSCDIVFSKSYDLRIGEEVELPQGLPEYLSRTEKKLCRTDADEGKSGMVFIPGHSPLIVTAMPILTSQDEGPLHGTLVFGRYLDSDLIRQVSELTSLTLSSYSVNNPELPERLRRVYVSLLAEEPDQIRLLDERYIAGYTLLDDIYGNPGLMLEVKQKRDIFLEGQLGISYLLLAILVIGILFGIIAMVVADKQGLSRLSKLAEAVENISTTGDISQRISVKGDDQMSLLASRINGMLGALNETYEQEKQLRYEIEAEMKRRIDFTRALVHELKTPLTPLLTSSDLLISELTAEPYLSIAKNIYRGATRLDKRIDELLDVARGEIGTLKLVFIQVNPSDLLHEIVDYTTHETSSHGISLELNLPSSLRPVHADEERIRQVILNLVNNACRYTPEGGMISLSARENKNSLIIEVRDTGSGIAEDEFENIFIPYYRFGKETQKYSGLGLGLALCKMIVELHGGEIWVSSVVGEGSTFAFSIPYEATELRR